MEVERVESLISVDLNRLFERVNLLYFDNVLEKPVLKWNPRLRTSAGRFTPGSRKYWQQYPPLIEVASYLLEEEEAESLVWDTLVHEMIHYWLWFRRKPHGHTAEFVRKMKEIGVSRYNPVPRRRPYRYVYRCPSCSKEFLARRRWGVLACARCCDSFSEGRYDSRFRLFLEKKLA